MIANASHLRHLCESHPNRPSRPDPSRPFSKSPSIRNSLPRDPDPGHVAAPLRAAMDGCSAAKIGSES